jgi:hypothetical protein
MPAMTAYSTQSDVQLSILEAGAKRDRFSATIWSIAAPESVLSLYSGFDDFAGRAVFDKLIIEELMLFR